MTFTEFMASMSPAERRKYAKRAGTSFEHLKQIKGRHTNPSLEKVRALVVASKGKLELHATLRELRPDIFDGAAA